MHSSGTHAAAQPTKEQTAEAKRQQRTQLSVYANQATSRKGKNTAVKEVKFTRNGGALKIYDLLCGGEVVSDVWTCYTMTQV